MLRELDVLVLDCQAAGATPAHGDLLELGWAVTGADAVRVSARSHWIAPRTDRGVSRVVRKLTGWSDECLAEALAAEEAWRRLRADAPGASVPTVIHFARFELPFLEELHALGGATDPYPFDTVCLHAVAQRLFPDLPRRNLRALAGHLGHSAELVRRSAGHVEASAFIWRALLPKLEERGVRTWDELKAWLDGPAPSSRARGGKRVFPFPVERRRALPDAPGVYRFLRPNGDVLYVGKAANLKKRVASHFTAGAKTTERALEMLSQVHDVEVTPTATALEAALLETDEIKRLDPPYNVQLRAGERHAWFASRDWHTTAPAPDERHRVGPFPSARSVAGIAAIRAMLEGHPVTTELRAAAVGVPVAFAPPAELFDDVWRGFVIDHLSGEGSARARILRAAERIVLREDEREDDEPDGWDPVRTRRYLEQTVFQEGLLVRRAKMLTLLAEAVVEFREPGMDTNRVLDLALSGASTSTSQRPSSRHARQSSFDAARYDRLRILSTELRRVAEQGGAVSIRIGRHAFPRRLAPGPK